MPSIVAALLLETAFSTSGMAGLTAADSEL
jgi:hypothetical protein